MRSCRTCDRSVTRTCNIYKHTEEFLRKINDVGYSISIDEYESGLYGLTGMSCDQYIKNGD